MSSTVDVVRTLIKHGASLDDKLARGETTPHLAAMRGDIDILESVMRKIEEENGRKRKGDDMEKSSGPQTTVVADRSKRSESDKSDKSNNSRAPLQSGTAGDESIHVDTLMWDPRVSPRHLAIINGHTEIIKVLVSRYGADVHLAANDDKSTLALSMRHGSEKAKLIVKTLLDLGAPSAQILKKSEISTLHYAARFDTFFLELMSEHDLAGFKLALEGLSHRSQNFDNPLTSAIWEYNISSATKLIDLGAMAQVSFQVARKATEETSGGCIDKRLTEEEFNAGFEQPIILAAEFEMPQLMKALLASGVDPPTPGTEGIFEDIRAWWVQQTIVLHRKVKT